MTELENILGKENIKYNESMSKHTSFKVGGNADIFALVDSEEKLQKVLKIVKENNMSITIVGNGTNLLVRDGGIRGIVIKYTANNYEIKNDKVKVSTGISNARLAKILLDNNLSGFEFAAGIPGTIGGALVMNAGAYGGEIKDLVEKTKYIDLNNNEIKVINNDEQKFEYRKSIFQSINCIILETIFQLNEGDKEVIKQKMDEYAKKRKESQPLEFPSAGSTFKRGEDFVTAKLIDEAGLKGLTIGGAEVSTKHAGFIVNKGNATANDIIKLINKVKEEVFNKFGKTIKEEVKIIGEE